MEEPAHLVALRLRQLRLGVAELVHLWFFWGLLVYFCWWTFVCVCVLWGLGEWDRGWCVGRVRGGRDVVRSVSLGPSSPTPTHHPADFRGVEAAPAFLGALGLVVGGLHALEHALRHFQLVAVSFVIF